MNFNE